ELVLEVTHAAKRRPLRNQPRRKGDRFLAQAALRDDGIENPEILRLGGADRAPAGDEIKSDRGAGDARQPLGSAGAGKQAERDLRQAELRGGNGDTIMAAERHLETAAERRA